MRRPDRTTIIVWAVSFCALGGLLISQLVKDDTPNEEVIAEGTTSSTAEVAAPAKEEPSVKPELIVDVESGEAGNLGDAESADASSTTLPVGSTTSGIPAQQSQTIGSVSTRQKVVTSAPASTQPATTRPAQTSTSQATPVTTGEPRSSTTTTRATTTTTQRTTTTTQRPADTVPQLNHQAYFSSSNRDGWDLHPSGHMESVDVRNGYVDCTAGGYEAYTHFARIRRKIPRHDGYAASGLMITEMDYELPADFYDRQDSYMRILTLDNYPTEDPDGKTWGANDDDEWRIGFLLYDDQMFRLISEHQNNDKIVLWEASERIPTGRHSVKVEFYPSQGSSGYWNLYLDGEHVAGESGVQTVPSSLHPDEVVMTGVGGCLDGAARQDSRTVSMRVYTIEFSAE